MGAAAAELTPAIAAAELARWREEAKPLELDGTLEKRLACGGRGRELLIVLDPSARDPDADGGPYEDDWKLATSLCEDENNPTPEPMLDGVGESLLDYFTAPTRERVIDARRRRVQAQGARLRAHTAGDRAQRSRHRARASLGGRRRPAGRRTVKANAPPTGGDDPGGDPEGEPRSRTFDRLHVAAPARSGRAS
jgi:hypothetical protein